ncbi:MAG TPA: LysR family transcriptional regulator [Ramlibacter sp.]|nr:LysR family transcriptional regulator [Ramlibacter sp.]
MITFKQLEAMYWVVKLGGFAPAAHKLHTTQSAVSKRVQELETMLDTPLFDRTLRTARLTDKGEEMYVMAERLLQEREDLMQRFLKPEVQERRVRIGVTEITAMTWLPLFVSQINKCYPKVIIDPDVDSGGMLRDKLLADEIDLMIAADTFRDERFTVTPVGKLRLEWMCRPGLVKHGTKPLRVQALQEHRILTQGPRSGTGILYQDWFKAHGLKDSDQVVSNSLLALIGLTVSGFGVSYLPLAAVRPMVDSGLLEVLQVRPVLPEASYAAIAKRERRGSLIASIATLAQESCDFTRLFQTRQSDPA